MRKVCKCSPEICRIFAINRALIAVNGNYSYLSGCCVIYLLLKITLRFAMDSPICVSKLPSSESNFAVRGLPRET